MGEVIVFHAAYGLRPSILAFADSLRAAGHVVHAPDLYDGEVFDDRDDALGKVQALGFDALLERAVSRTEQLPSDVTYIGFSNGGPAPNSSPRRVPVRAARFSFTRR